MFRRLAMGPEVVSGFLLGREVEARNLRLLLWGVRLGVPAAELQGRLREPYV
jgi:vacuolar-type H+-ATPase subunit C/Vma6